MDINKNPPEFQRMTIKAEEDMWGRVSIDIRWLLVGIVCGVVIRGPYLLGVALLAGMIDGYAIRARRARRKELEQWVQ